MSIQIFNNLFIDKIYCLYLEEFSERKEKALKHFQDMNLNVEMFQGTYYPQNGVFGCKMGHLDIIQEAKNKWSDYLKVNDNVNLHLIGKLQSNKVNEAFDLFTFIHTLDNEKLAKKFSELEKQSNKKIKYFIQVNIGNEQQKNGIAVNLLNDFVNFCRDDMKLNIIGLMCIPPIEGDPIHHFKRLAEIANENKLKELSI